MTYLCAIALTLLVCVGAVQAQDLTALWKTNRVMKKRAPTVVGMLLLGFACGPHAAPDAPTAAEPIYKSDASAMFAVHLRGA